MLWIRGEVFDHGIFNTSVRWTVAKVLDYVAALHLVATDGKVTNEVWAEAATLRCKPVLSEAEATAYWQIFSVLHTSVVGIGDDAIDVRAIGLILMCQVFSVHRARTNPLAQSEMWPVSERGPAVTSPRQSPRGASPRVSVSAQGSIHRGKDTPVALLSFVRSHLASFLQVVCSSPALEPANVELDDFNFLGLILCAGSEFTEPYVNLSEGVPEFATRRSVPLKTLKSFVEWALAWNEELYPCSEPTAAPPLGGSQRTLTIAGLTKSTWFQRPSPQVDFLNIDSCKDSIIYFTSQAKFCLITGCHDCTIIVGAVSSLCTLQNCEKVSVHVAAHCFKIDNSTDSSAYVYCHWPPVLTGDTRGIKLAPFNVLYSGMNSVLKSAGMALEPNCVDAWAQPVCCTLGSPDETLGGRSHGGGSYEESASTSYHFVHPQNFQPVLVPEPGVFVGAVPGATLCLPQVYDDALVARREEMQRFHQQLAEITDVGRRRSAQQGIQGHFREWLQATGKSRQLADLARMGLHEQVQKEEEGLSL